MPDLSEFEDELRKALGEGWQPKILVLPQPPPILWWARHLDDGDRAEFLSEVAVAAGAPNIDLDALERCLEEWQKTAVALADPAVREILTAEVINPADFTEVQRPRVRVTAAGAMDLVTRGGHVLRAARGRVLLPRTRPDRLARWWQGC